tara:strand:- start:294 stop:1739 length:1446 start_codon:yes stop_codon:yes gene_type:complete
MRIIGNNPDADNAEITAVASGALANGSTVVVNTDGTVSAITGISQASGTVSNNVTGTASDENSSTFDSSNNKIVVFYRSGGQPHAKVGTVGSLTTSFGSAVTVKASHSGLYQNSATFDSSNNKVIFAWKDSGNSSYGTAIVGTVSGTSISFGTPVVFAAAGSHDIAAVFDSSNNKVVIGYRDQTNSHRGTAIVGTVSGTSISFGSAAVFEAGRIDLLSGAFDSSNNKVVFAYQDEGNSNHGTACVITVSGTSNSPGPGVRFNQAATHETSVVFDSNSNKIVISYRDGGNSNHGTAIVGTVSGTSISFGNETVYETSTTEQARAVFDSSTNKVTIFYDNSADSNLQAVVGTVSGTSISFGSAVVVSTDQASDNGITAAFDSNSNQINVLFLNTTESDNSNVVFRNENTDLTSENFIGFSNAAYADTQTATIEVGSAINNGQSSLTIGQQYFVQTDGTIGTTAADPSVIAGTAISATEIIVKG